MFKFNFNHQKLTGEFHKHCRTKLGFKKLANRRRKNLLIKLQKQEEL